MKLVYLTGQKYPSKKVDPFYRKSMAAAFARLLGEDFTFVVRAPAPEELASMRPLPVRAPRHLKTLFYFVKFPLLVSRERWSARDVVIFSYDPYLLAVAIFWRSILRYQYRVISDWHQLYEDWRDSYVAKRSDLLVTTSKRLKGLLVKRFAISPERVRAAYGGVDLQPFQETSVSGAELRAGLGLPAGAFLVGYVGGFTSVGIPKGLDTMLEALPLLPKEIRAVFVGGSEREIAEYQAFARKRGVAERAIFVRRQPFEKVVEYERAMDALVIPYPDKPHFREYGFPMKVWEYMAAGRPIIYSNLELIGEALAGRAHPFIPDSAQDLARVVEAVRREWEVAERVAAGNPREVLAYTWDARVKNIVDFIRTLNLSQK